MFNEGKLQINCTFVVQWNGYIILMLLKSRLWRILFVDVRIKLNACRKRYIHRDPVVATVFHSKQVPLEMCGSNGWDSRGYRKKEGGESVVTHCVEDRYCFVVWRSTADFRFCCWVKELLKPRSNRRKPRKSLFGMGSNKSQHFNAFWLRNWMNRLHTNSSIYVLDE